MSVLSLPSSAGIARMRWELQRNDVMDGLQALRASDPLWRVSLEMSPDLEANSGYLKALFLRLRGPVNQVELHDWARPVPVGTYRGVLTLASSVAAGATSMSIVAANDNLLSNTEAFNLAPWGGNCTVTPNTDVAPDGTSTADTITGPVGDGWWLCDVPLDVGVTRTNSLYLKTAGTPFTLLIYVIDVSSTGTNLGIQQINCPLTSVWQRFSGSKTSVAGTVKTRLQIGGASSIAGKSVVAWGAKTNLGAQATAYGFGQTLKKGDLLGIGSGTTQQVVMVTEDATSTSQGNITVHFQPPLRNAFAGGQSVVWDKPKALFRRVSNELGWDYRGKNVITSGMAIDLIEDTRAA